MVGFADPLGWARICTGDFMIKNVNSRYIRNALLTVVVAMSFAGGLAPGAEAAGFSPATGHAETAAVSMSTFSQQQAIAAARNYLRTMPFSRAGLIGQL